MFAGDWRGYDPFDATHRLQTHEIPSPAVCSMFRTYQGWTALTRQGPRDGTLRLIPMAAGIAYVLLRALQDDVDETDLCGAAPGRALGVSPEWHPELIAALVSIPEVMAGDTVFWHTDICHAVGDEHAGSEYASVMYIGSAPDCPKNRAYLPKQREAFLAGAFGSGLRGHGLRSRLQGPRDGGGSDGSRTRPNGLLTARRRWCVQQTVVRTAQRTSDCCSDGSRARSLEKGRAEADKHYREQGPLATLFAEAYNVGKQPSGRLRPRCVV